MDQVAVLADPAQAGLLRPGLVEQGGTVDAGPPGGARRGLLQPASQLAQAAVPEAVSLEIPAINFGGDAGGKNSKDDKGVKGAAKVGKDAKEAPKGGKGAPPSAAGATSTLTDALSQLVRSYSVPVVAPPRPLANGADGPSREEALVAEWSAELSTAIEGERCKLVRRLGALCRYGCDVLDELRRQAERTQAELDGMLGAKMGKDGATIPVGRYLQKWPKCESEQR